MLTGAALLWLAAASGYDIRQRRLPNWLTLPGAVAVLVGAAGFGHGAPALAGAAALTAIYLTVHLAAPGALGAGDVKLAIGVGALTGSFGVEVWLSSTLLASLLTAVIAMVALVLRGARRVPHGPSMCLAAVVAVTLIPI